MKPVVASIDSINVIMIFECLEAASEYADEHPDQNLSISVHKGMKEANRFAHYLHRMNPEWKLEL